MTETTPTPTPTPKKFLKINEIKRLPASTEQEREWRRILGNRMVRADVENIPAGKEPQSHYNLQITPENYEKFLRGEELSEDVSIELQMPVEDKHLSSYAVHGGVIALLVDSAMGYAVFLKIKPYQLCSTIEFKINYFRPVTTGQLMVAKAKILHFGKSHVVVECEVLVENKLIAKAMGTFNLYIKSNL
eukprot:Phypoly_transcript_22544.p1 GENE.Phypoly_transcript_22544~~Phypoly_transcript_22544.p1  ORF type:complete len:189 (+),score=20.34 Phypoly_transcript_22544:39-605(+)